MGVDANQFALMSVEKVIAFFENYLSKFKPALLLRLARSLKSDPLPEKLGRRQRGKEV